MVLFKTFEYLTPSPSISDFVEPCSTFQTEVMVVLVFRKGSGMQMVNRRKSDSNEIYLKMAITLVIEHLATPFKVHIVGISL